MITLSDKTVNDVIDYLPFGEQIQGNSGTSHKFTGYERDPESNLDYASARHYNSAQGRFMTPDPAGLAAVSLTTPQSLNQYAYGLGNPLLYIDPSGLDACEDDPSACDGGGYSDPNFGLGDGYGGVYLGGPIWNQQKPIFSGPASILGDLSQGSPCESNLSCGDWSGVEFGGAPVAANVVLQPRGPRGAGAGQNFIGVDDVAEAGLCIAQPEICIAVIGAVGAVELLRLIHMSQHGRGNVSDTGIMNDVRRMIQAGIAAGICEALDLLAKSASAAGDTQRLQKIKATQKAQGCRASRQ